MRCDHSCPGLTENPRHACRYYHDNLILEEIAASLLQGSRVPFIDAQLVNSTTLEYLLII